MLFLQYELIFIFNRKSINFIYNFELIKAAATESAYAIKRSLKNACPVLSPQQILVIFFF